MTAAGAAAGFRSISIIGLGLIGSSLVRAIAQGNPGIALCGYDTDAGVRRRVRALALCPVADDMASAVADAELVIIAVPVGVIGTVAREMAPHVAPGAVISDVGSSKADALAHMAAALPGHSIIPAHPVAGTENSGPDAGFATLFHGRWCIITPDERAPADDVERVAALWRSIGADVERMDAARHDLVLAVTSHLPHLIAYTIVGTASDLEEVTQGEVIKFSAGGFRDFTRIAASDPTMWRDVFLANRDAVLDILQRFNEDLTRLQRAIRVGDGEALFDHFSRTRTIRRSIIEQGQDDAAPDFGRRHD